MRKPFLRWLVRHLAPLLILVATSDIGFCAHFHRPLSVPGKSGDPSVSATGDQADHQDCRGHADCFCHGRSTADRPTVEWSDPSLISPIAERAGSMTPVRFPPPLYHPPPTHL